MSARRIERAAGALDAVLKATPSKSVTHRALVAAALAGGSSTLHAPLDAEDTRFTRDGLVALGVEIRPEHERWIVRGCAGALPGGGRLYLGDSGTSMRFLVAVAALGRTRSTLDGSARLRERPVQELAAALARLGGAVEPTPGGGGLPLRAGGAVLNGGSLRLAADRSSQFASALLLIGPCLPGGIDLSLEPPAVSLPYVELTARVMAEFGAGVERRDVLRWCVRQGEYRHREYSIEGDHSSASYFLAAPAVVGGRVRVEGLAPDSEQPDARLGSILEALGCRVERGRDWIEVRGDGRIPSFERDMGEAPDLVPTLAVLSLFAEGPCVMRGVAHLRHKESDRLEVLARNLRLLGRDAAAVEDRLEVGGRPERLRGGTVGTASDHRMAMAFAIAGLRLAGVELDDAACVAKSNPDFWRQFERLEG